MTAMVDTLKILAGAPVPGEWPPEARRLVNDLQWHAVGVLEEMKTIERETMNNRDAWYERVADLHGRAAANQVIETLGLQVGWWNPAGKRFAYDDQKTTRPDQHTGYTVPVYALKRVNADG